jgi:hypothetical protein
VIKKGKSRAIFDPALDFYSNPIIFIVAADPDASFVEYRNPGTPKKTIYVFTIASEASPAFDLSYLQIVIAVIPSLSSGYMYGSIIIAQLSDLYTNQ